jgi:Holliday junction resolvase
MVVAVITHLHRMGATHIRACVSGYSVPTSLGGCIPDITALYHGVPLVVEAETAEGLSSPHTIGQLTAFRHYTKQKSGCLVLAVAPAEAVAAHRLLDGLFGVVEGVIVWTL